MKCCYIWLLIIASVLAVTLGIYIFLSKSELKIIIPYGLIILGLCIMASIICCKYDSVGDKFKIFYDDIISVKNINDSAEKGKYLSTEKIELIKLYAEVLKETK